MNTKELSTVAVVPLLTRMSSPRPLLHATLTIERFLEYIGSYNIDLNEVTIKIDNGFEYDSEPTGAGLPTVVQRGS